MGPPGSGSLPALGVADFAPGRDYVAVAFQNGRVFAILHASDPALPYLPVVAVDPGDAAVYVFVHGGQEVSRFENLAVGTHEIPDHLVARLLAREYGAGLDGVRVRMCTCYGNMVRPGEARSVVGRLAGLLPNAAVEAYHGLVYLDVAARPATITLGDRLAWDPLSGPYQIGPPGPWERVNP